MRKTTIVVALLAATVASAHAKPTSVNSSRGNSFQTNINASTAGQAGKTAPAAPSAHWSRTLVKPAPAAPAARIAKAPAAAPKARSERRVASRRSPVRTARAKALSTRTETVALTRDVPTETVGRRAPTVTATAPTGSIHGMVTEAARQAGVSPALGHAVVKVESMYQPRATGKGGYIGLMQLSYQTAKGMGFRGSRQALYEPSANLQYGMRYLAGAVAKSGGNTCAAVSKYQGGHGVRGVTRAGAVYCAKVKRFMASAG